MVLEKTLESPLDWKQIQLILPKGNQSWIFIERTDAEAETPILWTADAKSWLIGKDPDAGKDWGQEEKGTTEDEMVGWHHRLNRNEFEQTLGDGDGQGGLSCCSPWGHKESDMTGRLNNTTIYILMIQMLKNQIIIQSKKKKKRLTKQWYFDYLSKSSSLFISFSVKEGEGSGV